VGVNPLNVSKSTIELVPVCRYTCPALVSSRGRKKVEVAIYYLRIRH